MSAVCLSACPELDDFGIEHTVSKASVAIDLSWSWHSLRLSDNEAAP